MSLPRAELTFVRLLALFGLRRAYGASEIGLALVDPDGTVIVRRAAPRPAAEAPGNTA